MRKILVRFAFVALLLAAPLLATTVERLNSNQQLSKTLTELLPNLQNQTGGYIQVHSDQPIWAWEIFGSSTILASAPPLP